MFLIGSRAQDGCNFAQPTLQLAQGCKVFSKQQVNHLLLSTIGVVVEMIILVWVHAKGMCPWMVSEQRDV